MFKRIDFALNRITMYRLIVYYLGGLLAIAVALSSVHLLPYDPFALLFSVGFLLAACRITNAILARTFRVPANVESATISALILALIITPLASWHDLWFLGWASVLAMASKYLVTFQRKHLFNPVAFAVAVTALAINQSASWWVGNAAMLPFVLIGGVFIVRKIRRRDLVLSFFAAALAMTLAFALANGSDLVRALQFVVLESPLFFFAFVFVTEPLTTPPTRFWQIVYGALVGVLFTPQIHLGSLYMTPELAILGGNVLSYLTSPKAKLILTLQQKIQIAPDVYDFIFMPSRKVAFAPGQYMEWTLGHADPDTRGNRRYFTLASSPTEKTLRLGVKFYPESSTYKQAMLALDADQPIVAAQLAGDFVLPQNPNQKCVFIAGGIGITPFRSMIQYLIDTRQRRSVVLFYANTTVNQIVYKDVFDRAQRILGTKTVYTVSDPRNVPPGWQGKVGYIDAALIQREVADYRKCVFYISGPNAMVTAYVEMLKQMGVRASQIKTDFFPGLA